MPNHKALLEQLNACREAIRWYDDMESYRAWRSCHQSGWMLWLAERLGIDPKLFALVACDCATRVKRCLSDGKATISYAAAAAAAAAADAGHPGVAAAYATDAAIYAAAAVAGADAEPIGEPGDYAAAYAAERKAQATIVRRHIPWRVIKERIAATTGRRELSVTEHEGSVS